MYAISEKNKKPFELKVGMKIEYLNNNRMYIISCINGKEIWNTEGTWDYIDKINWEETKKLNEVKEEPKKEFPNKPEQYIVWNPKGYNPKKIHNGIESAEKEVERLANANPNQEFYVLKVVKKAKGSVKVEWE